MQQKKNRSWSYLFSGFGTSEDELGAVEEAGEAGARGGGGSEPEGAEGLVGKGRHGGEVGGGAAKARGEGGVMGGGAEERADVFVDVDEKRWGIRNAIFHS